MDVEIKSGPTDNVKISFNDMFGDDDYDNNYDPFDVDDDPFGDDDDPFGDDKEPIERKKPLCKSENYNIEFSPVAGKVPKLEISSPNTAKPTEKNDIKNNGNKMENPEIIKEAQSSNNNEEAINRKKNKRNLGTEKNLELNHTRREDLLDNTSKTQIAEPVAAEHEADNVNWSELYQLSEHTPVAQDMLKVKKTLAPCSYVFLSEYTIEGKDKLRCNHCQFLSTRKTFLFKHIRTHHREITNMYECPYCPFKSKHNIRYHIITHHKTVNEIQWFSVFASEYTIKGKDNFRCNHCQFLSKRKKSLFRHIRTHHREITNMYECPYCPFKSKHDIRYHIITHHKTVNEIQWFRCAQCDYKCRLKGQISKHVLSHLNLMQRVDIMKNCDQCPKMFTSGTALRRHQKFIHNKGPLEKLKCTKCNYECRLPAQLRNHIEKIHTDPENLETIQCPECSFTTKYKENLARHKSKRHRDTFQCEKCAYQTKSKPVLNLHMINHMEVKDEKDLKFRCDKCDYKTYRSYSLDIHKLNHLKPEEIEYFYCYHCKFKAKRKDNLKTHILRHFKHNDVTLQCYICNFKTKIRDTLMAHIGKHSKEVETSKSESDPSTDKRLPEESLGSANS